MTRSKVIYKNSDIFNEKTIAIVNPVNCVGVMGKGLALEFKQRFPENFKFYKAGCYNRNLNIGQLLVYDYGQNVKIHRYIVNFPTKYHWKNKSDINHILLGLKFLRSELQKYNIESIAIPKLGCGLGGLNWDDVKSQIDYILNDINTDIIVCT